MLSYVANLRCFALILNLSICINFWCREWKTSETSWNKASMDPQQAHPRQTDHEVGVPRAPSEPDLNLRGDPKH